MNVQNIKTIPAFLRFGTLEMGFTSSPIEFTVEGLNKEIQADQLGEEILAIINQGSNLSITATFSEVTPEMVKEIYTAGGLASEFTDGTCSDAQYTDQETCELNSETWTPSTDAVVGFGNKTVGTNLINSAKSLVLTPRQTADADKSLVFWKAYPVPGGINYSGVDESTLEIEFKIAEDNTKPSEISKGYLGNPSAMPNYTV